MTRLEIENYNKVMNILVSGSLAYDRIMDFPGVFKEHILPEKIHILNVSFVVDKVKENFGGTAGNIAYNLALLGEKPTVLGTVGDDFDKYKEWMNKNNIDISYINEIAGEFTATANIMTDKDDNQITGFYPGPLDVKYCDVVKDIKNINIAIIAPEFKERMMRYVKIYKEKNIPYIFDPGQQITALSGEELYTGICGAKVLIGNDYEIQMILDKIGEQLGRNSHHIRPSQYGLLRPLEDMVEILVITKGAKGSEIYKDGKKIVIPPAKPKSVCDPTGAGDAYRAGFIKGLLKDWALEKIGKFAGLVSVYTVEKYGTQTHEFTMDELEKRYFDNYREQL